MHWKFSKYHHNQATGLSHHPKRFPLNKKKKISCSNASTVETAAGGLSSEFKASLRPSQKKSGS
jgi:hypothetical protein